MAPKDKFIKMRDEIASLSIFEDIRGTDLFAAHFYMLNMICNAEDDDDPEIGFHDGASPYASADAGAGWQLIEAYSSFSGEVYKAGGDLSDFILSYVMMGNDPFTASVLAGQAPGADYTEVVRNELAILQSVCDTPALAYIEAIPTDVKLPIWENSHIELESEYFDMLKNIPTRGFGIFAGNIMFKLNKECDIVPIMNPEIQSIDSFYGYKLERGQVYRNTEILANGGIASNVLLYGDAGTGKSSTVKACAAAFYDKGVRLIEIDKTMIREIPDVADMLRSLPLKFIIYIDDLSFKEQDDSFYCLKGILEGSGSGFGNNIIIYATSNRRHLIIENASSRQGDDLHLNDTLQETMSLAARFGLTITFSKPEKDLYLEIVEELADEYGVEYEETDLYKRAEAFAIRANGRSPRTAKQFIILCKEGLR
jgi:predicted AAA+ superfamily ATPase